MTSPREIAVLTTRDKLVLVLARAGAPLGRGDFVLAAWRAFPEHFALDGYESEYPDAIAVYSKLCGEDGLVKRGLVAHDEARDLWSLTPRGIAAARRLTGEPPPPRQTRRDIVAATNHARAAAAAKLAAVLDAHAHRLAADLIREREAERSAKRPTQCSWCPRRATTVDEDGDPACQHCKDERAGWAYRDATFARDRRGFRRGDGDMKTDKRYPVCDSRTCDPCRSCGSSGCRECDDRGCRQYECPCCPDCQFNGGTPTILDGERAWDGPIGQRLLYCPACGHAWEASPDRWEQAARAMRAYRVKRDAEYRR